MAFARRILRRARSVGGIPGALILHVTFVVAQTNSRDEILKVFDGIDLVLRAETIKVFVNPGLDAMSESIVIEERLRVLEHEISL